MKLLALIESPQHVCFRYRIEAFAAALAEQGWQLESLPLSPHTFERRLQLRSARNADAVILQRKLLPLWQVGVLRRAAQVLIYDFDDAVFCRDSFANKSSASLTRLAHFWMTIHASDLVIAGNSYLAENAAAYIGPERIVRVPTSVDPARYLTAQHDRRNDVKLAWIGQRSTLPSLQQAHRHLAAASRRVAGLELRVICNRFPTLDGVRIEPRQWSTTTEARDLADCDIGVSWLPDDAWSRGKCCLKVLQYMAAGLPVVANPVGMHRHLVIPDETGILASTPQEWADAIERLAGDPALRQRMGAAARYRVEREFSVDEWGPQIVNHIQRTVAEKRRQAPTTHERLQEADLCLEPVMEPGS